MPTGTGYGAGHIGTQPGPKIHLKYSFKLKMLRFVLKCISEWGWMETQVHRSRATRALVAMAAMFATTGPASATTIGDLGRVTARSAIIVDHQTGQILFARNPNMPLPPASTTKLMTAVVAMKSGRLDRNVKVSKKASRMPPSKAWLKAGWVMNMRDLVYAMMLKSANDASVVVAEGLSGSVTNFARRMNETAKDIGATRSHFVNPNGLPARGHHSTAADLAVIASHALAIPELRSIMSTRTKTIRPRNFKQQRVSLKTTNKLLGRRSFKLIGKTGYTRRARRCFAGAASFRGREVIVVVLGSNDLWGDLELLIDYGLEPPAPAPDWSAETGWRQALAPRAAPDDGGQRASAQVALSAPSPSSTRRDAAPQAPVVAEGDRGRINAEPRFFYHVQVASLRSKTIAEDLHRKVSARGYSATVEPVSKGGSTHYRVLVRNLADRVIARKIARDLSRELHLETQIIAVRG